VVLFGNIIKKKMNKTIVLTSIYQEFWGTEEFRKSVDRIGLPLHNAWQKPGRFTGHGDTLRYDYEALLELKNSYSHVIYADGADSLFLKAFEVPDVIIYSTEKAVWPPTPAMNQAWLNYYKQIYQPINNGHTSPWKFLNGGGWCGPIPLLIEFFERYGLNKYRGDINGQGEQAFAFLKATSDNFPIFLDTQCNIFQTTGFEYPGDFQYDENGFKNLITGTEPCILHGNGRTLMDKFYKLYNK